jgi:prevent-host-death family protein
MTTVGVRELRQRASELLRRVEAGETIEITDRGRPVAVLAPLPAGDALKRLRASGEVISATGDIEDLPDPMPPGDGQDLPSVILARLRRDER